jgi:putative aldouronate transport system substrate-binding protein
MPDVFFKAFFNNFDEVTYGTSGQIIPLNNLINKYAPNIKKILDDNPIIKRCITTTDGNIYTLPTMYLNEAEDGSMKALNGVMRAFWWINTEWLNLVGKQMPTTTDELIDVLMAFRDSEKCCKGVKNASPLVICGISELMSLFTAFGLDISQYYVQAGPDGKLIFGPETQNFKKALEFFRTLYSEHLINQDWDTFTETDKYSYGSDNVFGMYQAASPVYVSGAANLNKFRTVNPLTNKDVNPTDRFWSATYPLERGCFAITSRCQYPEVAIRWIDTLYDTDAEYWKWAIIGKEYQEWKWVDSIDEGRVWKSTVKDAEYSEVMGKTIVQPGDGMPYAVNENFFDLERTPNAEYVRKNRNAQMAYGRVGFPMVYFSKSELKTLTTLASSIDSYVTRFIAKAICEGMTESSYNDFLSFSGLNIDEYKRILQNAYNNFYGLE